MGEGILRPPFPRVDGELRCGQLSAAELADRFGTPLYVYDFEYIAARVAAFQAAFATADMLMAYSVKANGNVNLLRRLHALGCGADITSLGELFRARKAGIPAEQIVFAGVGKTEAEILAALGEGIYGFNVESRGELERIAVLAEARQLRAPFAIRVNPDVLTSTPHEYTATGHAAAKFGVPLDETAELYRWAAGQEHLEAKGIDVHIGSQIVDPAPYIRALEKVLGVVEELRADGIALEYIDIGGGYGIRYDDEPGMDVDQLAKEILPRIAESGLRLIIEPGRSLVGQAGVLLTRVQYVKRSGSKIFVIVDGGMSELIRPSHYGGYHGIDRVDTGEARTVQVVDIVGPICESGDFFARDREMEVPEPGETLAVRTAGAYGFSMASNYNGRLRPAEILVDGSDVELIRRRETLQDLIRPEEDLGEDE